MYIFNLTDTLTGAKTIASFSGASLNGEVKNLSKYQEYNITGAAANSKGQSNFTNVVTCRTGEDGECEGWVFNNYERENDGPKLLPGFVTFRS